MKKILISLCLLLASYGAFAQSTTFGFDLGADFGKFAYTFPGQQVTTGMDVAFNMGVFADFHLGNFSIRPALELAGKGGQLTRENNNISTILYYAEVPVDLVYHFKLHNGSIYLGAGPYLGFGTSATDYYNDPQGNTTTNYQSFGGTNGEYTNTDAGLNFIGGYQFKNGIFANAGYDAGFTNILNSDFTENSNPEIVLKTRTLKLTLGYEF